MYHHASEQLNLSENRIKEEKQSVRNNHSDDRNQDGLWNKVNTQTEKDMRTGKKCMFI
jgi:hypothetical protein